MSSIHNRLFISCLAIAGGAWCAAAATEYFVSLEGCDDTHDGRTRETAFASIQRGVDALDPGDTLTILPGEYFGPVRRDGLGADDAATTIRADIPGTAVLRGDVPVDGFERVDGFRFVYATAFPGEQEIAVINMLDTLTVLERQPNRALPEMTPGSFHQDRDAGRLYVSMPTLQPPHMHRLSAAIDAGHGLYLSHARRVTVEGLAVTGFNTNQQRDRREGALGSVFGIFIHRGRDCVIRDCRVWLNGQGIGIGSGQHPGAMAGGGNVIERCTAWANASQHGWGDRGGLTIFNGRNDTIRDSTAFLNAGYGVNNYGSARDLKEIDRNLSWLTGNIAWGNRLADVKLKAGPMHRILRFAGGDLGSDPGRVQASLFFGRAGPALERDSIAFNREADLDPRQEFADPDHHDYRLQSTSRFRGAGPEGTDSGPHPYAPDVFFVAETGDDSADGLSVVGAWHTLAHALSAAPAGATLYLCGGDYALPPRVALPPGLTMRARGHDTVRIAGDSALSGGADLVVERLDFTDRITLDELRDAAFRDCGFIGDSGGLRAEGVAGLRLERVRFVGVRFEASASTGVEIAGCAFTTAPGLVLDDAATVRYADYNAYTDATRCWSVAGETRSLADLRPAHARYSRELALKVETDASGVPRLPATPEVLTGGPWNLSLGRHDVAARMAPTRRMAGPYVHSVSDTTANLEWWVSEPGEYRICWGEGSEFTESVVIDTAAAGNFSLTGLRPEREYRFRIAHAEPFAVDAGGALRESVVIAFRTTSEPSVPRTIHVSPDGDDAADGRTRETALRTVSRAADLACPGDTISIGQGTYAESVRIRTTGEVNRPITFKAHPGEKVVFDGLGRALTFAFLATDKHHLRFDGLYFTGIGHYSPHMPWAHRLRDSNGIFSIYRGSDIAVTRCFSDGRGPGYGPGLLQAVHARDLLLRNNVIIASMGGGITFYACPDLRVEHNVFLRSLIAHIGEGVNEPDQPFFMTYNLFTDTLASKVRASMLNIGKLESMYETSNGFYLRVPDAERRMFQFYEPEPAYGRVARAYGLRETFETPPVITERTRMSLAEYQQRFNPESDSVVIDPRFQGTLDWERTDDDGNPIFLADRLVGREDLDFPHLFATHPELIERGIGLQPDVFADFHFNLTEVPE